MKNSSNSEFIVAAVSGGVGIFMLIMSWSEFRDMAKENPSVSLFVVGLVLLFMGAGNLSLGLKKRKWVKEIKNMKAQQPVAGYRRQEASQPDP